MKLRLIRIPATTYIGAALLVIAIALGILQPGRGSSILRPIEPKAQAMTAATALPELPRVYLDTSLVAPTGRTINVAAGGDLQAAINNAQPGDIVSLQSGAVFKGNFTLPNKVWNKQGSPWIIIRTSAPDSSLPAPGTRITPGHSSVMAQIISPNVGPAIETAPGAHHFRFIGIEFSVVAGSDNYQIVSLTADTNNATQLPSNIIIDRCYIHGSNTNNTRRGVLINSSSTSIIDSYLSNFHEIGADSQAIGGWNGPGPFKIVNNYLEGAGENFMLGGADPTIPNLVSSDIEFRKNHCFKPVSWKIGHPSYAGKPWTVKNLFELKNAQRVLIDGNLFEQNWTQAQNGFSILFTVRNQDGGAPWAVVQDVTFSNNVIRRVGAGMNLLGVDDNHPSQITKRIRIVNNLFEEVDGVKWNGPGTGFQLLDGTEDIVIEHNTVLNTGLTIAVSGSPVKRFIFRDNLCAHNEYGVKGDNYGTGNSSIQVYFPGIVFRKNVLVGGASNDYPADNFFPANYDAVRFVDRAAGNYQLAAGSPYKAAATDGKDIGWLKEGIRTDGSPAAPALTISNITAANLTSSSALITWNTSALSDSLVDYGLNTIYNNQTSWRATYVTSHMVTLTGLTANTTYNYRVRSRDVSGNLVSSANFTFKTLAAAPTPTPTPTPRPSPTPTPTPRPSPTPTPTPRPSPTPTPTPRPSPTPTPTPRPSPKPTPTPRPSPTPTPTPRPSPTPTPTPRPSPTPTPTPRPSPTPTPTPRPSPTPTLTPRPAPTPTPTPVPGGNTLLEGIRTFNGAQFVEWTGVVDASMSNGLLMKTVGCDGCEATAYSKQAIYKGDGYFEVVATETNLRRVFGLMTANKKVSAASLDFSISLGNNAAEVWELGVSRIKVDFRPGDVFRVMIDGGKIKYSKNYIVFYQSGGTPTYPMVGAVAFQSSRSSIGRSRIASLATVK